MYSGVVANNGNVATSNFFTTAAFEDGQPE